MDNIHELPGRLAPAPTARPRRELYIVRARESDADYFLRRSREERAYADLQTDPLARTPHLDLAGRYANLAAAIREAEEKLG